MNTAASMVRDKTNGRKIQAAIFDLDGVLMDTEWIAFRVWQEIASEHGGTLREEHFTPMIGLTAEETVEFVMQVSGAQLEPTAATAEMWERMIERINAGIEPMPGSVDLVRGLHQRGIPLAIASNALTHYILNALNGLGLRDYFREIVGVDQVPNGKPAPDVYLRAAERLGADPQACLAVEDSRVGSQAALTAGMRVLAVPSEHDNRDFFQACYGIYDSLEQVHGQLDRLLA